MMDNQKKTRRERVENLMRMLEPGWYHYADLSDALAFLSPDTDGKGEKRKTPQDALVAVLSKNTDIFYRHHTKPGCYALRVWENPQNEVKGALIQARALNGVPVFEPVEIDKLAQEMNERGEFNADSLEDSRNRVLRAIVLRQGQPAFRAALIAAYGGRCCISGCSVEALLEAAHLIPYCEKGPNTVQNGLLMRADLHTMFDRRLLWLEPTAGIEPTGWIVRIADHIEDEEYRKFHGEAIRLPTDTAHWPSPTALPSR